jgi:hypothetical protein
MTPFWSKAAWEHFLAFSGPEKRNWSKSGSQTFLQLKKDTFLVKGSVGAFSVFFGSRKEELVQIGSAEHFYSVK